MFSQAALVRNRLALPPHPLYVTIVGKVVRRRSTNWDRPKRRPRSPAVGNSALEGCVGDDGLTAWSCGQAVGSRQALAQVMVLGLAGALVVVALGMAAAQGSGEVRVLPESLSWSWNMKQAADYRMVLAVVQLTIFVLFPKDVPRGSSSARKHEESSPRRRRQGIETPVKRDNGCHRARGRSIDM